MPMDMSALSDPGPVQEALNALAEAAWQAQKAEAENTAALTAGAQALAAAQKQAAENTRQAIAEFAAGVSAAAKGIAATATAPFQALGAVAGAAVDGFQSLTGAVAGFVQASNPAEMMRFQMAIQDLMASLGVVLEPIIVAGEQVADLFNSMFTELQPVIGPVIQQLADVFMEVGRAAMELFQPILEAIVPALGQLLESLRPLIPPLQLLAQAVGQMFAELIRSLQPLLAEILPPLVRGMQMLADVVTTTVTTMTVLLERLRNWDLTGAANLPDVIAEAMRRVAANRAALARPRPQGPRTTAARQASLVGIEQLGQGARQAAFGARSAIELQQQANDLLAQIALNTRPYTSAASNFGWNWAESGSTALAGGTGAASDSGGGSGGGGSGGLVGFARWLAGSNELGVT